MSELKRDNSTFRANDVAVLLQQALIEDDEQTRIIAHILKDKEIIGDDEHNNLCDKVSNKQHIEAIDGIVGIFIERNISLTILEDILKHPDLNISKELQDLVALLLHEQNIDENLISLINWWEKLCANSVEVNQAISEIWPEKSLADEMWPLKFIHFCATQTENEEKLYLFLQKLKSINCGETQINPRFEADQQLSTGSSLPEYTPDSFGSFVVLGYDGTIQNLGRPEEHTNSNFIPDAGKHHKDKSLINEGLPADENNIAGNPTKTEQTIEDDNTNIGALKSSDRENISENDDSTPSNISDSDESYGDWFYENLVKILDRRSEINVLLQLMSPSCTSYLEDEKAWKKNFLSHVGDMADSLYEDFRSATEFITEAEKVSQTEFLESTTELNILRGWLKRAMPEMKKHTDIFTMLIKIAWPGDKWLEENWKQVLLLKIYADQEKFIPLVSAIHLYFRVIKISIPEASDSKLALKVSSSEVTDNFNKGTAEDATWLLESHNVLKGEYENLIPLLDIAWPKKHFCKKDGEDWVLILLRHAGLENNWKIVKNFVEAARFVIENKKAGRTENIEDFEISGSLIDWITEHIEKVNWVGWLALRTRYKEDMDWLILSLKRQSDRKKIKKLIRALKLLASVFQQSQQVFHIWSTPGTDATEMPKSKSAELEPHETRSRSRQKYKTASSQEHRRKSKSPTRKENRKKRSTSTSEQQYPTQVPHTHEKNIRKQHTGETMVTVAPSEKIVISKFADVRRQDPVQAPVVDTSSSDTIANVSIKSRKEHDASSKGCLPKIKDADTQKRMHEMDKSIKSKAEVNVKRYPRKSTNTGRSVPSKRDSKRPETHDQQDPEPPPPYSSGNYAHHQQNLSESTKNLFPVDNQNEYSHEKPEYRSKGTRRKSVRTSDDNEDEYSHEKPHSSSRIRTRKSVEGNNTKRNEESPRVQTPVKKEELYQKSSEKRSEPQNTSKKYEVTFYVTCPMNIEEMNIYLKTNGNSKTVEMEELPQEKNCFSITIKSWSTKIYYLYEYEENGTSCRELWPGNNHRLVQLEPGKRNIFFDVISLLPDKIEKHRSEWSEQMYKYLCAISGMSSSTTEEVTILLRAWVSQMKRGWKIGCNEGDQRKTLSVKAEDCLIEWLTECDKKVCSETKIITILLLLVVFKENNLELQRSLDIIFLHLSLEDLNKEQQNKIQSDIFSAYTSSQERNLVAVQLRNLFEAAAIQPVKNWLLALPLLDLIEKKQITVETISIKSPVREIDIRLPFADKLDLYTGKEYQQHFIKLADKINKLGSVHLWLIDTYQILLDYESIIKVTKCNKEIAKKFELGNLLTILLEECIRTTHEDIESYLENLVDIQDYIEDQFKYAKSYTDSPSKRQAKKENKFALDIFDRTATSMTHVLKLGVNSRRASIWFIEIVHHASAMLTEKARETLLSKKESFCNICNEIADIILSMELTDEDVEFLDKLWTYEWVKPLQQYWNNTMTRALTETLEKEDLYQKEKKFTVKLYLEKINPSITQESLQDCFGLKAMKLIEKELETTGSSCIAQFFGNKQFSTIKFVEKYFLSKYKEWCESKESQSEFGNLNFICKWQMANWLFSNFYEAEHGKYFGQKTNEKMRLITADIKKIEEQIYNGKIKKNTFEFVKDNTATICNFVGILQKKSSTSSVDNLRERIQYINKRQRDFDEQYGFAKTFFQFCKEVSEGLKVDCSSIENMYNKASQSATICSLITKDDLPTEGLSKKYFGLTKHDVDDFHQMHLLGQSNIFREMWFVRTKQEVGFDQEKPNFPRQINWRHVLKYVWTPAKEDTIELFNDTAHGSVKLDVLLKKFHCTRGSKPKIHEELQHLFHFFCKAKPEDEFVDSLAWTTYDEDEKKSSQIHSVFEINKAINVIRWICRFKETFHLQGNFESIEKLKNIKGTDVTLNHITDDFMKNFPDDLIGMSAENLQTLENFIQQYELVEWLHSKNDIEEIKTLGQLALTSACERILEMDKVECLTTAVEGFSPLIYKLDEIKGLPDLLQRFYEVWKNVEEDEDLVKKWTNTGDELPWCKEIEQLYSSEEKKSLSLAQEINERGVYTIGKPPGNEHVTKENSILLSISRVGDGRAKTSYTLKDLTDLHSKLTLIAGEEESGQRDIANFVELLTAIKLLASAYVDLVDAGCMLFADWSAVVWSETKCGEIRKPDQRDLKYQIKFIKESSINGPASVSHLKKLSKILRDSYDRWSDYLNKKRLEHYYLNEYSIQQITYLCKELAKTKNTASLPDQVLALLSMSNDSRKLFSSSIRSALEEATKIDSVKMNAQLKNDDAENVQYSRTELKRIAIRTLIEEEGVSESLAIAAVQAEGHEDLEECNNWVTLNELDKNLVEQLCKEFQKSCAFEDSTSGDNEAPSLLHNRSSNTLAEVIKELQTVAKNTKANIPRILKDLCDEYLKKTSVLTLKDYLSVEHLGKFFTVLHADGNIRPNPHREALFNLKTGRQNLLICRDDEVLQMVLSIYMEDNTQPLPTTTEVLVCGEETTSDEVERFMRRAMCKCDSNGQPIYCMAHTEKLSFNVSKQLEKISDMISRNGYATENYRLIFISCDQHHYISECFEKYQMEKPIESLNKEEVSKYLAQHLNIGDGDHINNSSVKVVTSKRSGLGKTLYIRNLRDKLDKSYHKTTIPLVEEWVNTELVIERLYRGDHIRNEHSHFIHLDLTPAVQYGTEKFMFDLLVLGSIQNKSGSIWHRQNNHQYVVEVTKSILTHNQVPAGSILNLLPCIYCLGPDEAISKSTDIRKKIKNKLKEVVTNAKDSQNFDAVEKICQILDQSYNWYEFVYQTSYEMQLSKQDKALLSILDVCDIPLESAKSILPLLPGKCRDEVENLWTLTSEQMKHFKLVDKTRIMSPTFQRPYQYLKHYEENGDLDSFKYAEPTGTSSDCVSILRKYYTTPNPTWAQLEHFARFLNVQLENCENSTFCQEIEIDGKKMWTMKGLKQFAVKFMIRMSQDFATPSLMIHDESNSDIDKENAIFNAYKVRRKWENEAHPYVFFNEDGSSMTFINVHIDKNGDLLNEKGFLLEKNIASPELVAALKIQQVPINTDFYKYDREKMLDILSTVMGLQNASDPDCTFELTTDNVLKILAIYMRMRCGIPVIIMGETGCGKTRMIEFMSKLNSNNRIAKVGNQEKVEFTKTLKIHGGVTAKDIYMSVEEANSIAENNAQHGIKTILFYDEANTTNAIYAIKEVMCDQTVNGELFQKNILQIVAACNPYKKLSEKALDHNNNVALGFHVAQDKTKSRLGNIPMRHLVYKVVGLPPSMQPFVWDFGQLSEDAEKKYIGQMTKQLGKDLQLSADQVEKTKHVVSKAQSYMRKQLDECRYVSLRDVERCMLCIKWFYRNKKEIFPLLEENLEKRYKLMRKSVPNMKPYMRCLIQTIGVCYHVSLRERQPFRKEICKQMEKYMELDEADLDEEFIACQKVFIDNTKIDDKIARNEALRENLYLITICSDLKIPLFIIGKPGSSKSLAKTIVGDNMQGAASRSKLYKGLKKIQILNYQCSALTDAAGIARIFSNGANMQKNRKLDNFAVVVVLDEIGLAEDSKNMPLKILHPLLESGSTKSGTLTEFEEHKKVGFVGISNWALDPAKMNRGIFVTRSTPGKDDLMETAKGIFYKYRNMMQAETEILQQLTYAYLAIYNTESKKRAREYFGLRDYYCLIKMIHAKKSTDEKIGMSDIMYFVQRNFSGGVNSHFNSFLEFVEKLFANETATKVSVQTMIRDNLEDCESRFMLLLTNQYSSVSLLQKVVPNFATRVQVIFGSSFPGDHSYTELCRNINKIKVCMETGRTVVLLGTSEIHESLYDALNQHYIMYGGKRYVDIGLGGHRVKCRMSKDFRLIIIEKQETVHKTYPIPLINRLEKYHLVADTILDEKEKILSKRLEAWVEAFSNVVGFNELDAFVGHNDDTVSSTILAHGTRMEILQDVLLQSATIDSVFRLKSNESNLKEDGHQYFKKYLDEQIHDTLQNALGHFCHDGKGLTRLEITSFSNILTGEDREKLEEILGLPGQSVKIISLNQFQTQEEYIQNLNEFFTAWKEEDQKENAKILLIQCPQAHKHGQLLACARYNLMNALKHLATIQDMDTRPPVVVAFLLSTKRQSGHANAPKECLIIQQSSDFQNFYVDELRPRDDQRNILKSLCEKSLLEIFQMGYAQFNGFQGNLGLNFSELIKDCICESMSKLKTDGFSSKRSVERIKILKLLCSENKNFLKLLGQKMVELHENSTVHDDRYQWIAKEALSRANLQEGGTFTNCLNLCLKRYLADALAYIVSKVDENNNLNFLLENITWKQDMWLKWFEAYRMSANDLHSKHEYIIEGNKCKTVGQLPFSFCISDMLESIWKCVQHAPDSEKSQKFYNNYRQMHEQIAILKDAVVAGGEKNLIQDFAKDVISFWLIQAYGGAEKNHLTNILVAACMHEREMMVARKQYQDADSIAIVFYCFKEYKRHLTMLHSVYLVCPEVFSVVDDSKWLVSTESKECYIYELILIEMLKWFDGKALSIDENDCKDWMENSNKIKRILKTYLDELVRNQDTKADLIKQHEPLLLFDLLLSHLLPTAENSDIFANYVRVIVAQAKRWIKASRKYEIKSKNFLKIISNALRKSYEAIRMKHLVSWQETICQMCRESKSELVKLVCNHFICTICLNNVFSSPDVRKQCPVCPETIDEDFTVRVHELSEEDKRAVAKFKSNCTSFFLQYLRQFCFTKSDSASKEEAKNLLHELVTLSTRETGNRTDLNEAINLNIATKSYIWLVLEESFPELNGEELDSLYKNLDNQKLRDLVNVVLYSIETDMKTNTTETKQQLLTQCDSVTESWDVIFSDTNDLSTDSIRAVSKIRCAITVLVSDIKKKINKKRSSVPLPLYLAIKEIAKMDETQQVKKFIIKTGFQLFGKDWVYHVSANFKHFMPENLRNFVQENSIDYWLTMGQDYAESKSMLDNSSSGTFEDILLGWFPCQNETEDVFVDASEDTNEDHDDNNLTKYNLLTKVFAIARHKNEFQFEQLKRHIENFESYRFLSINDIFTYSPTFVNNQLSIVPENRRSILFQLVSLAGCVALADCEMMHEFHELIMQPEKIKNKIWPAMPQSHVFMIRDAMEDVAAYECENGHVYTIGNCMRPWVQSQCPKCGVLIVGKRHKLANGNKRVNLREESQAGYQLNRDHKGKDDPADRLSKQAVAILHFITHSCMMFGIKNDPDTILSILSKENEKPFTENDTKKYITEMLWTNLSTLAESLGRNLDDAILVICECILNVAKDNPDNGETDVPNWDSMQSRQQWEKMFHKKYLLPVFQTLDDKIKKCTKQLMSEKEMIENHFYRITHDVEMQENKVTNCLHPMLWSTIKHPNSSHLLQTIGDTSSPGVIQKILQTPKLHLARHLESVLNLQKILIEKYRGKDLNDVENITFENFMGDKGYQYESLVETYFNIWNLVRNSVSLGRNQKLKEYMTEMNMQSSVAMGIPSSRGHGRCAQLLAVYLIKIHNDFISECHSVMRQESLPPVPVSHLVPSNFIHFEKQNDLMKMIHTHTSYTIERDSHGSHHIISYNVDALEKQARESYAIYPPIIDIETVPCMRYPQDVGIGSDWKKTKEKQEKRQKQVTLTLEIAQEVDEKVASNKITPADLYGGVRTLTNAISFLANVEADPEQSIRDYLCDHLSLSGHHVVMIPISALIKHTLALYQRLTWHKAVNFVQQNLDPYKEALYGVEQTEITDKKTLAMIKDAFDHMDIRKFQQNLNEILIQVPDIKPFWSLREDVFPYFEFIEEESTDSWYNKLPVEIYYRNVSHLFKLSVNGVPEELFNDD